MSLSVEDLKQTMARKSDEELYDVVHAHSVDYTGDAIEAAQQELRSRNLDASKLSKVGTAVAEKLRQEKAPLEWRLRIKAFFISPVFLFIPTLLAHRRYIERGEKRKARDWARWAGFGFAFYVLAVIIIRVLS